MKRHIGVLLSAVVLTTAAHVRVQAETLPEALVSAYQTNPRLAAARAALRVTDEDLALALAGFRPRVEAQGTIGRITTEVSRQNNRWGNQTTGSVTVVQPVLPLSALAALASADAQVELGRAELVSTEQQVLLTTVQAYVDVLRDQQILAVTGEIVASLLRELDSNQRRFDEGDLSRTDIALTRTRLTQVQADQVAAEASLRRSLAAYQEVVGHPALDLAPPGQPEGLPDALDEATSAALSGNPSLIMARRAEDIARADIGQADAGLYPTLNVVGSTSYSETSTQFSPIDEQSQLQLQLRIPLYEGGATQARIRKAKGLWSQRRAEFFAAERAVTRQVSDAFTGLRSARDVIGYAESGVEAARQALDGVRQEAVQGFRTTLDVLQSEQNLLDAQRRLVAAQRDEVFASWQLLAVMGTFVVDKVGLPTPTYDPKPHADDVRDAWFSTEPLPAVPARAGVPAPRPAVPEPATPPDTIDVWGEILGLQDSPPAPTSEPAPPALPEATPVAVAPAPAIADQASFWTDVFGIDPADIEPASPRP